MFSYGLASAEGIWSPLQPVTYTYLPAPWLLPPIQAHNFCSRPQSMNSGEPREFHYFHTPTAPQSWWAYPQAYANSVHPLFPGPGYLGPALPGPTLAGRPKSWAPWPEGSSLQAELRWGRVERVVGPRLELPDFVQRDLRRVYGTYPHTDARVTFRGGEFLVQAAPRAGEPKYRVGRREVRAPASRDTRDSSPSTGAMQKERGRQKKKKKRA